VEDWQRQRTRTQEQQFALVNQKAEKEKEFTETTAEVRALRRQPSNIPAHMLDLRARVTQEVGLSETALPFAGEWLEVEAGEAAWQGAIERVLRGLALSVLVEERYYARVSTFVNEAHLGGRLVYHRCGRVEESAARPIPANSLWHKLRIKSGSFTPWLDAEIKQRFDYLCADSMQAFRAAEKAVTREGQIRHGKTASTWTTGGSGCWASTIARSWRCSSGARKSSPTRSHRCSAPLPA
jgi:uncharacterized protein YPO0396